MELPDLGKHCTYPSCKQLDFLPIKCDSCLNIYCKDHMQYDTHECKSEKRFLKDFQVPVCPLCNQPVPFKRNEIPDIVVSAHIDRDCKSDPAEERRRQIFNYKCSKKGCKQKELSDCISKLLPISCKLCNKNYCLKHRHSNDHECARETASASSVKSSNNLNAARLAFFEKNKKPQASSSSSNNTRSHNPAMSDDDALKLAIQLSLREQQISNASGSIDQQVLDDEQYARSLMESEQQATGTNTTANANKDDKTCSIH